MRGDLRQRLPVDGRGDEFDRLAGNVNRMLDKIEHLMGEMRSVGDAVAHDLRTPLTRLRARLERSRDHAATVDEFREAVGQGLAWIDQTLAMVTAVLRIGEMEDERRRAAFGTLDLKDLAEEAVDLFEPLAEERGIRLQARIAPVPAIHADRDLCAEALSNLIDNALKFTPEGGTVQVVVARRDGMCLLAVEDTGPGIPAAERERVFRRFYRAEAARATPGNGLGLGLVAAIAKLHGATIAVTEAPGGGCRLEWRSRRRASGPREPHHALAAAVAHRGDGDVARAAFRDQRRREGRAERGGDFEPVADQVAEGMDPRLGREAAEGFGLLRRDRRDAGGAGDHRVGGGGHGLAPARGEGLRDGAGSRRQRPLATGPRRARARAPRACACSADSSIRNAAQLARMKPPGAARSRTGA